MGSMVKTVSKGVLKAQMLAYFREVETSGEALIVTNNGQPVLKVIPYQPEATVDEVFAGLRGQLRERRDLLEPTTLEWNDC